LSKRGAPSARYAYRIVAKGRPDPLLSSRQGRFHEHESTSYAGGTISTAWIEVAARFGGLIPNVKAFELWRIGLRGLRLADLRDPAVRSHYGVTVEELRETTAPKKCREVARQLRADGYDGAAYESAQLRRAVCYVLFIENIEARLEAELAEDEWDAFARDLPT